MPTESLRGIPRRSVRKSARHCWSAGMAQLQRSAGQEGQILLCCGGRLFHHDGRLAQEISRISSELLRTRIWVDVVENGVRYRVYRADHMGFFGLYVPSERPAFVQRQSGGRALVENDVAFQVVALSDEQQNRKLLEIDHKSGLPAHFKAGHFSGTHYLIDAKSTRPNFRIKLKADAPLYVERRVHVPASPLQSNFGTRSDVAIDLWVKDPSLIVPEFRLSLQQPRSYAG